MVRFFVVLMCVVALSGCRHRRVSTVGGPGMNVKREAALLKSASVRLSCDARQMVGTFEASLESNYHVYRVDGCGKRFYALLHCTGICKWREAPEMRAETELQCPVPQLSRTYDPSTNVFTIAGCGRAVSYELGQGHLRPVHDANALSPVTGPPPPPPPSL